ncbi:hypothetical protein [Methylobrevis albus]|uniref:Uncharacterized protein n=1 Tax=Methylobrevis albus TaxID=2793297 RepID=A0A931I3M5_9HYPH|nr:hypothetical protein [Methylobrevis albus]MBH0238834.1 hypothetical protein [Methylobrevis albus]
MDIGSTLDAVLGLLTGVLGATTDAVQSYPWTTTPIVFGVFVASERRKWTEILDANKRPRFKQFHPIEWAVFCIILVAALAIAAPIGFIANYIFLVVSFIIQSFLMFLSAFSKNAVAFVLIVISCVILFMLWRIIYRRKIGKVGIFATVYAIAFTAFVMTSLYSQLAGEVEKQQAGGSSPQQQASDRPEGQED